MRTAYISFASGISEKSVQSLISAIIEQVNKRVEHLYIMFTSNGGSTVSGYHLYNFLRALPIKITTHACGMVASMGPDIFLAGDVRLAAPNAFYMFHSCGTYSSGWTDQRALSEDLEFISFINKNNVSILTERTKITEAEAKILSTGGMKSFGTDWALEKGIIHSVSPVKIPLGATIIQPNF